MDWDPVTDVEKHTTRPAYWAVAVLAPLLLAAACLGGLAIDETWLASRPPNTVAADSLANVCVSLRVSGGWRAAAWWEPAISARTGRLRRPFTQPHMACGLVPWQAWLPSTGELETGQ